MGVGPWLICFGVVFVLPMTAFVIGYKAGKGDIPLRVTWGNPSDEFDI
jgi:hypothetical protein